MFTEGGGVAGKENGDALHITYRFLYARTHANTARIASHAFVFDSGVHYGIVYVYTAGLYGTPANSLALKVSTTHVKTEYLVNPTLKHQRRARAISRGR